MNLGHIFSEDTAAREAGMFIAKLRKEARFRGDKCIDRELALVHSRHFLTSLLGFARTVGFENRSAQLEDEVTLSESGLRLISGNQVDFRDRRFGATLAFAFEVELQTPQMRSELNTDAILSDQLVFDRYWAVVICAAEWLYRRRHSG